MFEAVEWDVAGANGPYGENWYAARIYFRTSDEDGMPLVELFGESFETEEEADRDGGRLFALITQKAA